MEKVIIISILAAFAFFLVRNICVRSVRCQHDGCRNEGIPCYLTGDDDGDPSYLYCEEHAFENGFCWGCGQFYAGIEDFDFGNGLCEHCREDEDDDCEEYGSGIPYLDALDEQDYF
jgi:hypothetical protein